MENTGNNMQNLTVEELLNGDAATLVERGFLLLKDGKWRTAEMCFDKAIELDFQNAYAYWGKLRAIFRASNWSDLSNSTEMFFENENYQKAYTFASQELRGQMELAVDLQRRTKVEDQYRLAIDFMEQGDLQKALELFQSISSYKDVSEQIKACEEGFGKTEVKGSASAEDVFDQKANTANVANKKELLKKALIFSALAAVCALLGGSNLFLSFRYLIDFGEILSAVKYVGSFVLSVALIVFAKKATSICKQVGYDMTKIFRLVIYTFAADFCVEILSYRGIGMALVRVDRYYLNIAQRLTHLVIVILSIILIVLIFRKKTDNNEQQNSPNRGNISSIVIDKQNLEIIEEYMRQGKKLDAIKVVREISGVGLAEAKNYVENLPHIDKSNP